MGEGTWSVNNSPKISSNESVFYVIRVYLWWLTHCLIILSISQRILIDFVKQFVKVRNWDLFEGSLLSWQWASYWWRFGEYIEMFVCQNLKEPFIINGLLRSIETFFSTLYVIYAWMIEDEGKERRKKTVRVV